MDKYVLMTSEKELKDINKSIAEYVYATNASFRSVEHPTFKNMLNKCRPGLGNKGPTRSKVANELLEEVYLDCEEYFKESLCNKTICLAMDGWSNVHREPIVCVTATVDRKVYLIDSIDTQAERHTGENTCDSSEEH